jgi:FlaG/FlaF family flagellin (archaellin)
MKGIESVIAIILILMITVALAALAYVWFTGVFQQLTTGAGQSVNNTVGTITTQFSIESAKFNISGSNKVTVVVRNTGSTNIDATKFAAFIENELKPIDNIANPTITPNSILSFVVGNTTGLIYGVSAPFVVSQTGKSLKITGQGGVTQTVTIS